MEYLAFIKPSKELTDLITARRDMSEEGSGLHSTDSGPHITLCIFNMDNKLQEDLASKLDKITFQPFTIRTESYDCFDKNSRVIRVSRSLELQQLHERVAMVIRPYVNNQIEFDERLAKYGFTNYVPHITIGDSRDVFDSRNEDSLSIEYIVDEFKIHRKNSHWHEVYAFKAKKQRNWLP